MVVILGRMLPRPARGTTGRSRSAAQPAENRARNRRSGRSAAPAACGDERFTATRAERGWPGARAPARERLRISRRARPCRRSRAPWRHVRGRPDGAGPVADSLAHAVLEAREVRREHGGEPARRLVVGVLVGPRVARPEHLRRDVRAAGRAPRSRRSGSVRVATSSSAPLSAARTIWRVWVMFMRSPGAVRAARPAGVDQPDRHVVAGPAARRASRRRRTGGAA